MPGTNRVPLLMLSIAKCTSKNYSVSPIISSKTKLNPELLHTSRNKVIKSSIFLAHLTLYGFLRSFMLLPFTTSGPPFGYQLEPPHCPQWGDVKPAANLVDSPVIDKYDEDEPEPEPIFFDAQSEHQPIIAKPVKPVPKQTLQTEPLDTSLDPVVPLTKQDTYTGGSPLCFTNAVQPIDPKMHVFPRKKMIPYNEVTYSEAYKPLETEPDPVEEIEPVPVPVPCVPHTTPTPVEPNPKQEASPPL